MKNILFTRFIHLKKYWISFIFWLVLPLIGTVTILQLTGDLQEETKIPVGIVLEEETTKSLNLFHSIKDSPLLRVYQLSEHQALNKLEKHELDSVFIIKNGYEEAIRKGSRNQLITSYHSNLSFAYTPVKEIIVSLVQQETGRSKAAYIVEDLSEEYHRSNEWTWDEIVETSQLVQEEENLLNSTFSYRHVNQTNQKTNDTLLNAWDVWAVLSILCSLFIFDWVIKEHSQLTRLRFTFLRMSHAKYLLGNLVLYTVLFLLMDIISFVFIRYVYEPNSLWVIFSFRIMLTLASFLMSLYFRRPFIYYSFSVALTLVIAISSGAILPIEEISSRYKGLAWLNPFHAFLSGQTTVMWTIIFMIFIFIWYFKEEDCHNA